MNAQAKTIMQECTDASDAERITFPEVVAKLMSVGVEQYHADLRRAQKTYYMPDGASHVVPAHAPMGEFGAAFSAAHVAAAIRASQAGTIKYREFCDRIREAGCVFYIVSLAGRRAVYFGRTGEQYVEHFPPR
jgi:uncharacterized protein YbcV (DUF1398 family)